MSTPAFAHAPSLRRRAAALVGCVLLSACSNAPEDRLDPVETLKTLEDVTLTAPPAAVARVSTDTRTFEPNDGLDAREASAIAIHLNPRLRTLRAEIGVARAQLVEAGLLPDPTLGWESGNVVADFITDRKSSANSYVAGFFLEWSVPRPGEIGAREAGARGRIDEARATLLQSEWQLVGEVHAACVRLAAVEAGLRLNAARVEVAERTTAALNEARQLGEVTALDARLAGIAHARVLADQARLEVDADEARQTLLWLLGLPPTTPFTLQDGDRLLDPVPAGDPAALLLEAVRRRPDLLALAAQHAQAEARLRLEEARRWPQLTVGSGIGIQLPFFTRFNAAAVETALRAREAARLRFEAAVHEARRAVHAAAATLALTDAYVRRYEEEVVPAVEETVRLARASVEAGEFTAFDVLIAQTQAHDIQTELLAARARRAVARVALDVASGRLIPTPEPAPGDGADEE